MYRRYTKLLPCDGNLFILILISLIKILNAGDSWNYRDPDKWPEQCNGNKQSPIAIDTNSATIKKSLTVTKHNYDEHRDAEIANLGHTVQIWLKGEDKRPYITGTALNNEEYVFEQLHFHWGHHRLRGSEHAIDGRSYAMEMHLVHRNEKYADLNIAAEKSDGLAVLGIIFQVTNANNSHFASIIDGVSAVPNENPDGKKELNGKISLADLLPPKTDLFFQYSGSLTTPPCSESVTWIVYPSLDAIGESQIKAFRELKREDTSPMGDTYRDLQNSKVDVYYNGDKRDNSAVVTDVNLVVIALLTSLSIIKSSIC